MNLDPEDRKQLITLLQDLPELGTEQDRREMLESAGLKQLASNIDLSGAPFMAVSRIVSYLSNYGRLKEGNEALELFLNTIKGLIGVEQQEFLQRLLGKYPMLSMPVEAASQEAFPTKIAIAEEMNNQSQLAKETVKKQITLAEADESAIEETLYLLSIPGMAESIKSGLATPIEECSEVLDW